MKKLTILAITCLSLAGCKEEFATPKADAIASKKTENLMQEAARQVDVPAIVNFAEKRLLKQIYELRDQNLTTYTYIVDLYGKRHFLCRSQGYGIPYSAQFTNPVRVYEEKSHQGTEALMPQPEPNGMFMPESSSATWVLCLDEAKGEATPVYVEPLIIVTPFRMD